jgi:hypothetical protein
MERAKGNITPHSITKAPSRYLEALGGSAKTMIKGFGVAKSQCCVYHLFQAS